MSAKSWVLKCVWLFLIPWTVAHQAPLSIRFSRQEYWGGLPCPPPAEDSQPRDQTPVSCLAGGFFTTEPWGKSHIYRLRVKLFSRAYWGISSPQILPSFLFPEAMTSKCLAIYFIFTVIFPGSMVISLFSFQFRHYLLAPPRLTQHTNHFTLFPSYRYTL